MASGHVNRTNRPNTWPHRPACDVKILLANLEPSTHGAFRTRTRSRTTVAVGSQADTVQV
jgi:hypothetical protein